MSTPQLLQHSNLNSAPPLLRRQSTRTRLHLPSRPEDPPIPPRLIGSPLLDKLISSSSSKGQLKPQQEIWIDGNEFGTTSSPATSPVVDTASSKKRSSHSTTAAPRYASPPTFATPKHAATPYNSPLTMADFLSSPQSPRSVAT